MNSDIQMNSEIKLRAYNPETDKGFVFSTFLDGLYYGNDFFNSIDKQIYYKSYGEVLEALLAKTSVNVVMAVLNDDEDVILGYAILDNEGIVEPNSTFKLHYSFVKKMWRNKGIHRMLTRVPISTVTHVTKPGLAIARKRGWIFNPFAI